VLTDREAEAVTESGLATAGTISISRRRSSRNRWCGLRHGREGSELLNGAQADAIGFAERAADGSSFGHAHLGSEDQERHVGGIGVAVADVAFRDTGAVNRRFENPAVGSGIAKILLHCCSNPGASAALRYS